MPSNITKIKDYKGWVDLVEFHPDKEFFEEFAFETEKTILRGDGLNDYGLLGDEVYNDLIADLDSNNNPQTAPYINLVDGVNYTQTDGTDTIFIGLRKMLTYFVFAKYVKQNILRQSLIGSIKNVSKVARQATVKEINYQAHLRWNKGVNLYNNEVYQYILFYQSDFTNWEFTKQSKFIIHGIV